MSSQPSWHCIANLGDVNPLEYGGKFVMIDKRGVYTPEMWIFDEEDLVFYTVILTRCHLINDVEVSDNRFHTSKPAWFSQDLRKTAESNGIGVRRLADMLCDSNPIQRAHAYEQLVSYHGTINFDSDPWKTNYKKVIRILRRQIAQADGWKDGIGL